jgi:uncharacterized pyridoxal phosphate-containing UPF0001 family protein
LLVFFDFIHSVDRLSLAEEISKRAVAKNLVAKDFTAAELRRRGDEIGSVGELSSRTSLKRFPFFRAFELCGLMALPPLQDSPAASRAQFAEIRKIFEATREKLRVEKGPVIADKFCELSMGTTGDFEQAIAEGATMIRVGTAIFGERT